MPGGLFEDLLVGKTVGGRMGRIIIKRKIAKYCENRSINELSENSRAKIGQERSKMGLL